MVEAWGVPIHNPQILASRVGYGGYGCLVQVHHTIILWRLAAV